MQLVGPGSATPQEKVKVREMFCKKWILQAIFCWKWNIWKYSSESSRNIQMNGEFCPEMCSGFYKKRSKYKWSTKNYTYELWTNCFLLNLNLGFLGDWPMPCSDGGSGGYLTGEVKS